jgi:cytochrome c biogenesis protein CcmG/thiol:disulfide interchange protein DsbE
VHRNNILIAVIVVAIALCIFFYAWRTPHSQQPALSVGALAPGFSLPDFQGGHVDLSAYRGKLILLDFWATWCDPCRDEVPHFVELQEKYRDQGLQIIGISMDDGPEPVREFFQKYKMNYPVAMGNAKIGEAYGGILGLPIAFLLGRDGRIYSKHIGATDVSVFEKEIVNLLKSK